MAGVTYYSTCAHCNILFPPPIIHICHYTEFQKIALATLIGFAIMGFIGYFVKLIHIPINNIIV